jgi:hypothetical protein
VSQSSADFLQPWYECRLAIDLAVARMTLGTLTGWLDRRECAARSRAPIREA